MPRLHQWQIAKTCFAASTKVLIFAATILLMTPSQLRADLINVAFQSQVEPVTGAAAVGAAGDVWNTPFVNNV